MRIEIRSVGVEIEDLIEQDLAAGMPHPASGEPYLEWLSKTEEGRRRLRRYLTQLPEGKAKEDIAQILAARGEYVPSHDLLMNDPLVRALWEQGVTANEAAEALARDRAALREKLFAVYTASPFHFRVP